MGVALDAGGRKKVLERRALQQWSVVERERRGSRWGLTQRRDSAGRVFSESREVEFPEHLLRGRSWTAAPSER